MKITERALPAIALACAAISFNAAAASSPATEEDRLLSALQKAHPGTQFTRVVRTPIPELYEVWMGANMAFPARIFAELGPFHTALDRSGKNLFGGGDTDMIRRVRAAGLEVWFAPAAKVRHQMPASRTTFRYATRHAFDSARSRVVDRASQGHAVGYLAARFAGNLVKVAAFLGLALLSTLVLRTGDARKALDVIQFDISCS